MFQKLIFKPRSKSNKNCIKDTAKNKKKKKTKTEKDSEDPKILDERENKSRDEKMNATNVEAARERNERCEEDPKIDEGIEISIETETRDKRAESVTGDEGEDKMGGEGSQENGEPVENSEVREETSATVETQSETKEKEDRDVAEVKAVIENGIETDEAGDENTTKCQGAEPADGGDVSKEVVAEPQATNQNPDESQE